MSVPVRWLAPALTVGSFVIAAVLQAPLFAQTANQVEAPAATEQGPLSTENAPIENDLSEDTPQFMTSAIMQGLDKITARVSEFDAPIGETVHFGSFEIVAKVCEKTPPEEPPESTAFLEITDIRPDEPARVVFKGWMFASSPALSAVEHPVYDVWVTGCRISQLNAEPATAPETDGTEDAAEGSEEPTVQ